MIQGGLGDQFMSYLPESVKKIGLWDERFIFSVHVRDYLYRAVMYNRGGSTINDSGHNRILNPIFPDDEEKSANYLVDADPRQLDEGWDQTSYSRQIGYALLEAKYGNIGFEDLKENPILKPYLPGYVFYPYFEKDVYDLHGKNYLWEETFGFDEESIPLAVEQMNIISRQFDLAVEGIERSPLPAVLESLGLLQNARWVRKRLENLGSAVRSRFRAG